MRQAVVVLALVLVSATAHAGKVKWKLLDPPTGACSEPAAGTRVVRSADDAHALVGQSCEAPVAWAKYAAVVFASTTKTGFTVKRATQRGKTLTLVIEEAAFCSGVDEEPQPVSMWIRVPRSVRKVVVKQTWEAKRPECSRVP